LIPVTQDSVEAFRELTAGKLRGLRCPDHGEAPRLRFRGESLRDISIQLSGCCEKLLALANRKIAERSVEH
jgi:hypothetical protein